MSVAAYMSKVNKIMKRLNESQMELGLVRHDDGTLASNKQESLEWMLEEHFPNSTKIDNWTDSKTPDHLRHIKIKSYPWLTRDRFRLGVQEFKNDKAPGPDEFRAEILRVLDNKTVDYLLDLFTVSIQLNYVPSDWRRTKVLFPSKPNKTDSEARNSFRPISLMSVLFKLQERLCFYQMEEETLQANPLHDTQFGFRRGRSTEHALSNIVNEIERERNKGHYVLGTFLDIKGAFSCVSTEAILTAMERRNIHEDIRAWYRHFLNERTVESTLGDAQATIKTGAGCPQGGVNSGLLWNLVNDELLKNYDNEGRDFHSMRNRGVRARSFVDDSTLLATGTHIPTIYNNMQNALNSAQKWAEECGLTFCPKKCNSILFTNKRKPGRLPKLKINGQEIPQVKTTRLLGVLLDSQLTWKPHIEDKIKKCKGALMKLRAIIGKHWSPQPKYLRWIYTCVIIPMLTHASVVWDRITEKPKTIKDLKKLQRLGLTAISRVRLSTPTAALEHIYDVPPLHLQIQEKARLTYLRLGELQKINWEAKDSNNEGHIARLRNSLPTFEEDDTIVPTPNRNRKYTVKIDYDDMPVFTGLTIYTDGSVSKDGKTGSGTIIKPTYEEDITLQEKLPPRSIFQAELRAIQIACENLKTQNTKNKTITMHVDSQGALRALAAPYLKSQIAKETADSLNDLSNTNEVNLQWIKAHTGDSLRRGNDLADMAAKTAAEDDSVAMTKAIIRQPRSVMQAKIRESKKMLWHKEWAADSECRQTKEFIKTPNPKIWLDLKDHSNTTISRTIRFITGHGYMRRHKHIILKREKGDPYDKYDYDPEAECSLCQDGHPETPIHLITNCPVLFLERHNLFSTLKINAIELSRPPEWSPAVIEFANLDIIKQLEENRTQEDTVAQEREGRTEG